jgi:hypothetical protein
LIAVEQFEEPDRFHGLIQIISAPTNQHESRGGGTNNFRENSQERTNADSDPATARLFVLSKVRDSETE